MMRSASTGAQLNFNRVAAKTLADESSLKGLHDVSATRRPQDQPFLLPLTVQDAPKCTPGRRRVESPSQLHWRASGQSALELNSGPLKTLELCQLRSKMLENDEG